MARPNRYLFKSSSDLHIIHEHSEILAEKQKAHRRSLTCGKSNEDFTSPRRNEPVSKPESTPPTSAGSSSLETESPSPAPAFKLESLQPRADFQELQVYSQLFEDIIRQDSTYGSLLAKIKAKYDAYISGANFALQQCEAQHQAEVHSLQRECTSLTQELEKLLAAAEPSIQPVEENHIETINRLCKELRVANIRENKYVELLKALKQAGAPVSTIYHQQFKARKSEGCLPFSPPQHAKICSSLSPEYLTNS